MKKFLAIVLVVVMVLCFVSCGKKVDFTKAEGAMDFATYTSTAVDKDVTIDGFVQLAAYNATYGNVCLYVQDDQGAYYVYRAACDATLAAKLTEGTRVLVKGKKAEWSGEVEIADATIEVLEAKVPYVAEAADVTEKLAASDLDKYMNQKIAIKGAKVVATKVEDKEYAFTYGWENSAKKGENADLYFNVEVAGKLYNVCVESDECAEGTEVYKAVEGLAIGDTVNLEGFLYWYSGANPHITKVTK